MNSARRNRKRSPLLAVAMSAVLLLSSLISAGARFATPSATPVNAESATALPPAWLEIGVNGHLLARIIVSGECPSILLDGVASTMRPRSPASDAFPVIACESTIPFGVRTATIGDRLLPLPAGPLRKIAVIGDTGCRLNNWEKKFQACNDPRSWPFAEVAWSVAAWKPDLIVHVGDFLYRESSCPAESSVDCLGSPHGDNWETWNADFFAPATTLLGSAPWLFMRGNHETCERNPQGWFRYLDPRPYQATCQIFTEPYLAQLNGLTFAALDSAEAADTKESPQETAEYKRQFAQLAAMAPPDAWLVTHRPIWGILEGKTGEFEVENATYASAVGASLGAAYGLVLSGHIHLAEAMAFAAGSGRPPQIIAGNAGTALDTIPTASPAAGQLGDPQITEAETLSSFGFLTLQHHGDTWRATQRDASGAPLRECELILPGVTCILPS